MLQTSQNDYYSHFYQAIREEDKETAQILINDYINVDAIIRGNTPLHWAVHNAQDTDIILMLIHKGANIHVKNYENQSALHLACRLQNEEVALQVIQLLLEYGADIEAADAKGMTPLLIACQQDNYGVIKYLLENHANPDAKNVNGERALHLISKHQNPNTSRIINLLLEYNVDIEAADARGMTPLLVACENDTRDAIKCLLDNHANPNAVNHDNETPLIKACDIQSDVAAKWLLKCGALPNTANHQGQTALHHLCKRQFYKTLRIIELLLAHEANIEAVNVQGWTPLFVACDHDNEVVVTYLLIHGANPNHTDSKHLTPLHISLKKKFFHTTIHLIEYGANINILDENNRTPLQSTVENILSAYKDDSMNIQFDVKYYEEIIKILVAQEIKLKTAELNEKEQNSKIAYEPHGHIFIDGLKFSAIDILQLNVASYVDNNNRPRYFKHRYSDDENSIGDIRELEINCRQEIEQMKKKSIHMNDMSLYDLMSLNNHVLGKLVKKGKIKKIIGESYKKKFPLYKDIIRNRIRDAQYYYRDYRLKKYVEKKFSSVLNQQLPDLCVERVIHFLDDYNLVRFAKILKSSNV